MPVRIMQSRECSLFPVCVHSKSALIMLTLLVVCLLVASCQGPLGNTTTGRADFSLTFIISGVRPVSRSGGQVDNQSAQSRLILPTAASLLVQLQPEGGGEVITVGPNAIEAGSSTVPVSLTAVPYGTYTIVAEARDSESVLRFTQTAAGLVVGPEAASVRLNLVPADASPLEALEAADLNLAELPAGESLCYFIAAGAGLFAARSIFFSALAPDTFIFLQAADGTLLSHGDGGAARLSTVDLPAGQAAYLTVYNGGTETQIATRAFPGPRMVAVPGGAFQRDAAPANISRVSAFSMASLEVTRELYQAVMGGVLPSNPENPVADVRWYHTLVFCNRLSLLESLQPVYTIAGSTDPADWGEVPIDTGTPWDDVVKNLAADGYRLPTEMEWMWAAMGAPADGQGGGANTSAYNKLFAGSDGSNSMDDYVWHGTNSSGTAHPAGSKLPNEVGLYDMSGNVFEWCWDKYGDPLPAGSILDYQGAASGIPYVYRGGAYDSAPETAAVNDRSEYIFPYYLSDNLGFRVASSVHPLYQVRYNSNGATSGSVPVDLNSYQAGSSVAVLDNSGTLLKTGFAFAGWNTQADGYGDDYQPYGGQVSVGTAPVELYATWLEDYSSPYIGDLKAIPIGTYQRDATPSNISRIRQAYLMSATEITRDQWVAVTGWADPTSGFSLGTSDPVQNVNWYHVIAFCNKLSLKEGLTPVYSVSVSGVPVDFNSLTFAAIPTGSANADWNAANADWSANGYRLPTEMEWVWAAMGALNDTRPGDIVAGHNAGGWNKGYAGSAEAGSAYSSVGDYAWYDVNSLNIGNNRTSPVAIKIPNELGLYDMSGNVCEWMWDAHAALLPTGVVDSDSAAGRGLGAVTYRTKKGGSWNYTYAWCTVAFRINESPWTPGASVGFRVVRP